MFSRVVQLGKQWKGKPTNLLNVFSTPDCHMLYVFNIHMHLLSLCLYLVICVPLLSGLWNHHHIMNCSTLSKHGFFSFLPLFTALPYCMDSSIALSVLITLSSNSLPHRPQNLLDPLLLVWIMTPLSVKSKNCKWFSKYVMLQENHQMPLFSLVLNL